MLILLSPAKTLDTDTPVPSALHQATTEPLFSAQAQRLINSLKRKGPRAVAKLMGLSSALAQLNVQRYRAFSLPATPANSRPAVLTFAGDVYTGLDAPSLGTADLLWAQQHLVILSGLYGALRPLDALQPYRLEMGTTLPVGRAKNLYAYWGDLLTEHLNQRLEQQSQGQAGQAVLVNLASQEYFKAVQPAALRGRLIECVFEDQPAGAGGYKVVGFFAKRARGMMARYAVQQRLAQPEGLREFTAGGYAYAAAVSTAERWVFRRQQA